MLSTSFLVAFSITCLALYIVNIAKEEMLRIFAAIVAMLGFFFSLALAPWVVQALMLIFILSWRNLSHPSSHS